ncbi:MAG: family hydrolase [Betaproteobacteria bacterium]|nr:family hydrolase [Betaproteobacteria bacterium]
MAKHFDLVVFDWDGTLVDSTAVIVASLQAACADAGLPVPSDERSMHIIGLGLYDAMAYVLPGVSTDVYPRVVERYGHHFRAGEPHTPLFGGVESMLKHLHGAGHQLAIATGKSRRGLDRALEKTALARYFHATRCGEESATKPAPAMLLDLMKTLGTTPERTVMIGDTTHDLQMAASAGVASVAVTYGAHPREQLLELRPIACAASSQDLWQWLKHNA